MNFSEFLKNHIVLLDGGMGTLLQGAGLQPGEHPELWNLTHAQQVQNVHKAYFDAGSNVVATNTFGANLLKFSKEELERIVCAAVENARTAAKESSGAQEKFVALDIGPSGKLLKPLGDLDFEAAVSLFAETVKLGAKYGADLILIETMADSYETKAALLAAKENCSLPVIVTNAYGEDGKLMTGASPEAMCAMLEGMGASAIGANCSLGPRQLKDVALRLLACASVPVVLKPNAGLPRVEGGKTVFDVTAEEFAEEVASLAKQGLRLVGGCCGTTPEHIAELAKSLRNVSPAAVTEKNITSVSSFTHAVTFGKTPILIGERINPTGKKRLKEALREHDMDYVLSEGLSQQEKNVHILDVNVGLPEIDEKAVLEEAVCRLQAVCDLPLQIDTADPSAMEAALRRYNGKAMVNSVSGKQESMDAIFPLVKKYGGLVVALTLDENGIPETAEGRFAIAEKILKTAAKYGIAGKDIIFDTLAMTVSADTTAALATLTALRRIRQELGCHTSLGVSNVSFGLPNRDAVSSTFFALALENGMSAAIMNPHSADMMKVYYAFKALKNMDENCADYIANAPLFTQTQVAAPQEVQSTRYASDLQKAICQGMGDLAGQLTAKLIETADPMDVVQQEIIPALNTVGEGFEKKTVYLPQLLMSAEAAQQAFAVIKNVMSTEKAAQKGPVVLATVHGDIHDIGKNIVKLLLENYGFRVIDLGKDVPAENICMAVLEHHSPLCGLSALMTTTVPAMEETIRLLKMQAPWCRTVVGGAVLTEQYAQMIGADKYAADAMDTVRYAEEIM